MLPANESLRKDLIMSPHECRHFCIGYCQGYSSLLQWERALLATDMSNTIIVEDITPGQYLGRIGKGNLKSYVSTLGATSVARLILAARREVEERHLPKLEEALKPFESF